MFKVFENDGIEQRRGELFGHSSHGENTFSFSLSSVIEGGPLVEELDDLEDEPGPSTSRERGRRTGLSLGNGKEEMKRGRKRWSEFR